MDTLERIFQKDLPWLNIYCTCMYHYKLNRYFASRKVLRTKRDLCVSQVEVNKEDLIPRVHNLFIASIDNNLWVS